MIFQKITVIPSTQQIHEAINKNICNSIKPDILQCLPLVTRYYYKCGRNCLFSCTCTAKQFRQDTESGLQWEGGCIKHDKINHYNWYHRNQILMTIMSNKLKYKMHAFYSEWMECKFLCVGKLMNKVEWKARLYACKGFFSAAAPWCIYRANVQTTPGPNHILDSWKDWNCISAKETKQFATSWEISFQLITNLQYLSALSCRGRVFIYLFNKNTAKIVSIRNISNLAMNYKSKLSCNIDRIVMNFIENVLYRLRQSIKLIKIKWI